MVVHVLPSRISHVSYEYELIRQHTKDFQQAVGDGQGVVSCILKH